MPDRFRPDEVLKHRAFDQAMEGHFIDAQRTTARIGTREYQREVWSYILAVQTERGDVEGIKQTILSCTDRSLLHSHQYDELPLHFAQIGNKAGAIEIAETMGSYGVRSLLCILTPWDLLHKGDYAGAKEAVATIENETMRSQISLLVEDIQRRRNNSCEQVRY